MQTLSIAGNALYVGGSFSAYKGVSTSANGIAKLDLASGAIDTTFSPVGANGFDGTVYALASDGVSSLYVGGSFTSYRGGASGQTAKPVSALTIASRSLYAGGSFSAYQGQPGSANGLAKIDPTTAALDTTFSPSTSNGVNGTVGALLVNGSSLFVGGTFSAYRGATTLTVNGLVVDATSGAAQ